MEYELINRAWKAWIHRYSDGKYVLLIFLSVFRFVCDTVYKILLHSYFQSIMKLIYSNICILNNAIFLLREVGYTENFMISGQKRTSKTQYCGKKD